MIRKSKLRSRCEGSMLGRRGTGFPFMAGRNSSAPPAPAGLSLGAVTVTTQALSWSSSVGATSYNVYVDGVYNQNVGGTTATVTGLDSSVTHSYYVTAVSASGESGPSNIVNQVSYPTLRDYRSYWPMNESSASNNAIDKAALYSLTQTGNPDVLTPGRLTDTTPKYFVGTGAYDLDNDFTFVAWYNRPASAVQALFTNRVVASASPGQAGQIVFLSISDSWQVYIYNPTPTQSGPFASVADSSTNTWRMIVLRHTKSTKTFTTSIDNGAVTASGPAYTGTIDTESSSNPLDFGRDVQSPLAALRRRSHYIYDRVLSAAEEALLFAAGSTFIL